MKIPFNEKIIIGNTLGFLLLFYVFFQGYKTINLFQYNTDKLNETHKVLVKAQEVYTLSIKIQNSARGYIIKPNDDFKKEIAELAANIYSELGSIRKL